MTERGKRMRPKKHLMISLGENLLPFSFACNQWKGEIKNSIGFDCDFVHMQWSMMWKSSTRVYKCFSPLKLGVN